jgi:acyl carrier protein
VTTREAEVLEEIRRLAAEELAIDRPLEPGDRLVEDLGLDSMTLVAMTVAVEDRFRVVLEPDGGAPVESVGDLVRLVAARREEGGR